MLRECVYGLSLEILRRNVVVALYELNKHAARRRGIDEHLAESRCRLHGRAQRLESSVTQKQKRRIEILNAKRQMMEAGAVSAEVVLHRAITRGRVDMELHVSNAQCADAHIAELNGPHVFCAQQPRERRGRGVSIADDCRQVVEFHRITIGWPLRRTYIQLRGRTGGPSCRDVSFRRAERRAG
jgi:hypothetical protein